MFCYDSRFSLKITRLFYIDTLLDAEVEHNIQNIVDLGALHQELQMPFYLYSFIKEKAN
jgi:hypothetical protein